MSDIRMPKHKTAIEKRSKIIEKGFELMCEKGYFNTTTPDIAKYANVSTGIIYQYFNDKKDIFIEGVKNYSNSIMFPMISMIENEHIEFDNLETLLDKVITMFANNHTISKKAHEELMAMSHLDDDVAKIFKESELELTKKIVELLNNNNIVLDNALEKVHIAYGIIDNFCHEVVYHKHDEINYEIMKKQVIRIVKELIEKEQ